MPSRETRSIDNPETPSRYRILALADALAKRLNGQTTETVGELRVEASVCPEINRGDHESNGP